MTDVLLAVVSLLAEDPPRDTGPDFGKASPLGLVVVVMLLIGTCLLVWSMNRHLRRLPESFDREHPEPDQAADDGTVGLPSGASEATGDGTEPDDGRPRHEPG